MKIPMSWIREYVDIEGISLEDFVHGMTMSGSKVEAVERMGACLRGIVVGQVVDIAEHPQAARLFVCRVDTGDGLVRTIITAADNLKKGDYVPVAKEGAVLADGTEIGPAEMRGLVSEGMMCSIEELCLSRQGYPEAPEGGIYVFPGPQELGADVVPLLHLREDIVEFEITSNRVDCLSLVGLAREAAATFCRKFALPGARPLEGGVDEAHSQISVRIEAPDLCPRYACRVVEDVVIGPSPLWLRSRLVMAGINPINNIVDITNYVMLELGQPMHAFDIGVVEGGIVVRRATGAEAFTTLDGQERDLQDGMLLIADEAKPLAVAGVMGGENSKIGAGASRVLLESANFYGPSIRSTSQALGLRTESSSRFEKGLDPNLAEIAVNRAAMLVEELGCGRVSPGIVDEYQGVREEVFVEYDLNRINNMLNLELSAKEVEDMLGRLEINALDGIARVPSFRTDITREACIAEEVARLYGYDRIPVSRASGSVAGVAALPHAGRKTPKQQLEDRLRGTLEGLGLYEVKHFSFDSPRSLEMLGLNSEQGVLRIRNPLGEDFSIMRTTTLGGMLDSLALNHNRRNKHAWLFELGREYLPGPERPQEHERLTIGMYGGDIDFFGVKGILESLMESLGLEAGSCVWRPEQDVPYLHPGRSAVVSLGGAPIGFVGEVHPKVARAYDIGQRAYVAVLYMERIHEVAQLWGSYAELPRFPAIQRDIAVVVRDDILAGDILSRIRVLAGGLLERADIFDAYKGDQVPVGYVSLAFALSFRAQERTLTDEEVLARMDEVGLGLEREFGAKLRG